MTESESFTVTEAERKWWGEFKELRWRDKSNLSNLIVKACKEYYENHKEGNEQTTLDDPIICTPAFFRDSRTIHDYMGKCKDSEFSTHKFKLNEWNHAFKKRYGVEP